MAHRTVWYINFLESLINQNKVMQMSDAKLIDDTKKHIVDLEAQSVKYRKEIDNMKKNLTDTELAELQLSVTDLIN